MGNSMEGSRREIFGGLVENGPKIRALPGLFFLREPHPLSASFVAPAHEVTECGWLWLVPVALIA